jgi:anti-anti-sigma factor
MATSVEHRQGVAVLTVEGEVDVTTAPVLHRAIADALVDEPSALVIDLSAVQFLASAGLQILVEANDEVRGRADLAVVATGPATRRPIQLTGLDSMFSLHNSLDDALLAVSKDADGRD